jgi:hypothetical protein
MPNPKHWRTGCAAAALCLLAGCAPEPSQPAMSAAVSARQPAIELLGFPGCPNTPAMRANLKAALASVGNGWTFTDTDQEKLPQGDIRRGYPTPTILVNGCDLYGLPVPTGPNMGCRLYAGGVPDAAHIAARIKSASAR